MKVWANQDDDCFLDLLHWSSLGEGTSPSLDWGLPEGKGSLPSNTGDSRLLGHVSNSDIHLRPSAPTLLIGEWGMQLGPYGVGGTRDRGPLSGQSEPCVGGQIPLHPDPLWDARPLH